MENYEEIRQRRGELKARMDELSHTEQVCTRVEGYLENIDSRSQETLEHALVFYRDFFRNGFALRENLTDKDLQDRVVEASVLKILKKEIRTRQMEARKAKLSQRLHR